jgi:hypothetical protein
LGNNDAAPRSNLDQTRDGKLSKGLSNWRPRSPEPIREVLFVKIDPRSQQPGRDLVGQGVSYVIGEQLTLLSDILQVLVFPFHGIILTKRASQDKGWKMLWGGGEDIAFHRR